MLLTLLNNLSFFHPLPNPRERLNKRVDEQNIVWLKPKDLLLLFVSLSFSRCLIVKTRSILPPWLFQSSNDLFLGVHSQGFHVFLFPLSAKCSTLSFLLVCMP
ncbi:hypothetical protein A7Q09_08810 [Methylacidiphilum sp. Yel]|nr:hypothetical protein A7Q09_08810 [Methylacidiphilum sp. Yel]